MVVFSLSLFTIVASTSFIHFTIWSSRCERTDLDFIVEYYISIVLIIACYKCYFVFVVELFSVLCIL